MNTISRILGEATRPPTEMELTDTYEAYYYAVFVIKGPFPEGEEAIAKSPHWAYHYAVYAIEDRFPEGEAAIATDPLYAYWYAKSFIKDRFPEGEAAIATSPEYSKAYLKLFPEAKMEFFANGWIDWTGL